MCPFELLCFVVVFYMCLFDCKCKSLKKTRRKHKIKNIKKHKHTYTNSKKHIFKNIKYRNTVFPAHEPLRIICARRFVGWIHCISIFYVFLRVCLCCLFMFLSVVVMFSPSLLQLLHLQSKKHIYKHNKHKQENIRKT